MKKTPDRFPTFPTHTCRLIQRALQVAEQVANEMTRRMRAELNEDELRSLLVAQILPIVERYDPHYRFESYAAQRFRWAALSEFRKRRRRKRLLASQGPAVARDQFEEEPAEYATPRSTPEHALIVKQKHAQVRHAVNNLSRRHARVVRRHFLENVSCENVATELGISRSSVYRLRREAMTQLAQEIGDR
ncbi:MAG: sigma-70 family RNA polymerase sigma factor [Polyangiaceae bacterium]